jgi:hypothetical protein
MKHPLSCNFLNAARLSAGVSMGRSPQCLLAPRT